MPHHRAPDVAFVNERSALPGQTVPQDALTIVLTDEATTEAHQLSEPTRVAGYVKKDVVPADIASVIAALADICSRDSR